MQQILAKGNARTVRKLMKLKKEAEKEKQSRIATRAHAISLNLEGYGSGEIANILKVDRTRISVWINNWNEFGEDSLFEGHRSGRKKQIDSDMLIRLADIIDSGPIAYGLETGIWNSVIIGTVIENEFAIKYHPGHIRKVLKNLGFSVQRPTIQLSRAEPKKKNKWIRYTYPNLKKKSTQRKWNNSL